MAGIYTIAVKTNEDNYDDMLYGPSGYLDELLHFIPDHTYIDKGKVLIIANKNEYDEAKIIEMFEWDRENNCWTSDKVLTIIFAMLVCGLADEPCDYMRIELMEKGAQDINIYNDLVRCEKEELDECLTIEFIYEGGNVRCTMKEDDEMLVERNDEIIGWLTHYNIWKTD